MTILSECGPKQIIKDGKVQPGGNQSEYRGNISATVTGKKCKKWAKVTKTDGENTATWDVWAAKNKYYGLYYLDDPEDISFQHNFCRNPSPQKDLYGTKTDADVKTRAWLVNLNFINVLFEFCSKQGIMLKNSFRWVTI
jgi:hypothetical protein